jgi:pimeloyl-ACP methyl ester carboxylesterase
VDVLGHSIGAYFALEALRNHPEVVRTAVGVYPYITNNPTSAAQNFLSFLVHRRLLVFLLGECFLECFIEYVLECFCSVGT